jgi:hypothetical protein
MQLVYHPWGASAPAGADVTTVAVDFDVPRPVSRFSENALAPDRWARSKEQQGLTEVVTTSMP